MADPVKQPPVTDVVRELARQGLLALHFRKAPAEQRRRLRAGAFEIAWPLVFLRVTRAVERSRGHHLCATAVRRLAPDCLDHFHDDVDAVLDDLFTHADVPIDNLEGWLTMRMRRATINGYRRRRGERGAPQKPRVPNWLADGLGRDAWLVELARLVLEWVGTDVAAGTSLWPLDAWVERRAAFTRDHAAGERVVAADVEVVLAAMRRRPDWYDKTVERPLGAKRAPVHVPSRTASGEDIEPEPLALVARHERDEALLQEVAAAAIAVLRQRRDAGEDLRTAVADVLATVFGALPATDHPDRFPGEELPGADRIEALISDPDRLHRIVETVVELLRDEDRPSER